MYILYFFIIFIYSSINYNLKLFYNNLLARTKQKQGSIQHITHLYAIKKSNFFI